MKGETSKSPDILRGDTERVFLQRKRSSLSVELFLELRLHAYLMSFYRSWAHDQHHLLLFVEVY